MASATLGTQRRLLPTFDNVIQMFSLGTNPKRLDFVPTDRHGWADAFAGIRIPHVKYICPHAYVYSAIIIFESKRKLFMLEWSSLHLTVVFLFSLQCLQPHHARLIEHEDVYAILVSVQT